MRYSILILLFISIVFALEPVGFVSDFAGIIDDSSESTLNNELLELEKDTSVELTIVTIDSLPQNETVQGYSNKLLNEWGIGKKGEDNGLLILISVQERYINVETGYGLEGILPDGRIGRILDTHLDKLIANQYGTALEGIVADLSEVIRSEYQPSGQQRKSFAVEVFPYIVISSIIIVVAIAMLYNRFGNRCPKCRSKLHRKDISATKTKVYCLQCGWHKYIKHAAGAAAMGLGGRGGSRGGGGGFGGGRSGGGGAGRGF